MYPREGGPEARTIGLLKTIEDREVILEEPGGILSFYPWMVIFTIRVGEPEEQPAVKVGEPQEQTRDRCRGMPITSGWGGWYPP